MDYNESVALSVARHFDAGVYVQSWHLKRYGERSEGVEGGLRVYRRVIRNALVYRMLGVGIQHLPSI